MIILQGQGVSRGVAFGKLHFYHRTTINLEKRSVENAEVEVKRFETARGQAIAQTFIPHVGVIIVLFTRKVWIS